MAQTSSISNTGTYFTVNGMFDEVTGAPVVDTSLQLWLDAGQTASYSGTGNTWTDLSVGGNVGTISGATFNSISGGGAFAFDGSNDIVTIPNKASLDTQTPTVEVWVKTNNTNQSGFWFEKGFVNTQYSLFQEGTSILWRMYIGGVTQLSTLTATYMNTAGWYQVVGTYTSGSRKLYINGVLVNSDTQTGTIATDNRGMSIGAYGGTSGTNGYFYNGSLAICRVYNKVLSPEEVVQNYNANCGRFGLPSITTTQMPVIKRETSNAVILTNGYFDEFTGAPVVDTNLMVWLDAGQTASYSGTGATWSDLSVNAKNYTLNNSPTFNTTFGGGALTFTGASGHYANSATTLFNSTTINQYSVSIWVYPTGAGQMVSVNGQSTPNTSYHYSAMEITAAGLIYFGQWAPGMTTVATSSQSLNAWYNLVLTYNGTTATAYVNGVSVGSNTIGWSAPGASTFFAIMSQDGTNMTGTTAYASGSVGAFSVYNRALTAAEIVQNYNALSGRYNKTAITTTQMPVVKRETSTGIILVNGMFDEYTMSYPDGLTSATASTSAYAIKQAYPASTDGLYWIQNANINSGSPVQVYCDMTTLGGGWTLIMQNNYGDWSFDNALLRNQTSAPSSLAANFTSGTAGSNGNYSIIGWADYIKKSSSGFDYMLDAGYRGRNGGAWTANQAYSFTGQVDNTAYNANPSTYFGTDEVAGSNGFRQDITLLSSFNTGASGSGTWSYNTSGLEKRMPWYANNAASPGNSFVGGAIFTTTNDDSGSWWGTLMSAGGGWDPAPWQADTSFGYPKVIWYWVR